MTATASKKRSPDQVVRAILIDRISETGKRKRSQLHSDHVQIKDMERDCKRFGLTPTHHLHELDVSGGWSLERRELGRAIDMVERGDAEAIVFAYRDRADRSIVYGSEAIERMDACGGILMAGGQVLTHATPQDWANSTLGSFMGEFVRRQAKYTSAKNVEEAVMVHNKLPMPKLPLGLLRNPDGSGRLDDERVLRIVRECFRRRAHGATIQAVRTYLTEQGYPRSYRSVQLMLLDRAHLYLGEIKWGKQILNTSPGFAPIVDRQTWDAVHKARIPAGRAPASERLLSRIQIMKCGTCGGRMVVGAAWVSYTNKDGSTHRTRYVQYKCGHSSDKDICSRPASISGERVERIVLERVKEEIADGVGRASRLREARQAEADYEAARVARENAEARFMLLPADRGHEGALAQIETLAEDEERKRKRAEALRSRSGIEVIHAPEVLDDATPASLPTKRALIRNTLESITILPGRGAHRDRVLIDPLR